MIVTRNMLISMVGVCTVTTGLLIYLLCAQKGLKAAQTPAVQEEAAAAAAPAAPKNEPNQYAVIAEKKLFSPSRVIKEEKKEEAAPVPVQTTPKLNMLGGYPNDWPRLKLTGVFLVGTRNGAIISGGDALRTSSGDKYDSMYYEGDAIAGGVKLGPVSADSVVLYKDTNGWSINLGQDPPAVQKK